MKRSSWQIQRAVIFALVLRELKTRFGGRLIGLFWVLFEPLVHIAVLMLLKVVLRQRSSGVLIDVPVYLIVAMIPFFIFRNVWFRVMDSIGSNSGLFGYRQVKPADAMVSRAILEIVIYMMVYVCLTAFFAWMNYQFIPAHPIEYFGVLCLFAVMGFGFGIVSAIAAQVMPVVRIFAKLISFPLYMLSGVLVSILAFPPALRPYLLWNPMLQLVEFSRETFFASYRPITGANLLYPTVVAFTSVFVGIVLYRIRGRRLLVRN